MTDVERAYCQGAINALLSAYHLFCEERVVELLKTTRFGKNDTLRLDAIPEISIRRHLPKVDRQILFLTEESSMKENLSTMPQEAAFQPVIFISDPIDGSHYLETLFRELPDQEKLSKFRDIRDRSKIQEKWQGFDDSSVILSGATSSLSGIRDGIVFFSCIINCVTQDLLVSCEMGSRWFPLADLSLPWDGGINLDDIWQDGKIISFDFPRNWLDFDCQKKFVTYLGKAEYTHNLQSTAIFLADKPQDHRIKVVPVGPSRILYLSSFCQERAVGFILANGEKITEWIHWLPYVASNPNLCMYEIYFENPWTKDGILMATNPAYSIFEYEQKEDRHRLNLAKIRDHPDPARYRSTFLITFEGNEWVNLVMEEKGYRRIKCHF